jgi:hypothetical protein
MVSWCHGADPLPLLQPELTTSASTSADDGGLTILHPQMRERLDRLSRENELLSERLSQRDIENAAINERLNNLANQLDSLQSKNSSAGHSILISNTMQSDAGEAEDGLTQVMPPQAIDSPLADGNNYGLRSLFDSFHSQLGAKSKPWYEKMTIRGYSQIRLGRALTQDPNGAPPILFGDHSISGTTGTFSIRRARLILAEEVSDHLLLYFQSDFANTPADGTNTFFAQIRDLYGDIYIDTDKVNRLRVGQSKLPWGFEEMQSSGNRIPLDRSDAIDSGDSPNQRDLGVFYYWTPVEKQKLLKDLAEGGLKGTGNYGIFGFGVYNGQGGSMLDLNRSLNTVARFTWPFLLPSGQAVEMSIQGYVGRTVVVGAPIRPQGQGSITPANTGYSGLRDQRLAGSFVWYPQPFGFQAEWNVGQGPGLNNSQTAVEVRSLQGGYAMATYKIDTPDNGIFFPYARFQHYQGGYKSVPNAPYGTHDEYSLGVEWQIRKELELVVEYGFVNGVNFDPNDEPGGISYKNFRGQILRSQLQINY